MARHHLRLRHILVPEHRKTTQRHIFKRYLLAPISPHGLPAHCLQHIRHHAGGLSFAIYRASIGQLNCSDSASVVYGARLAP